MGKESGKWETIFDLPAKTERLKELEEITAGPGFWDNSELARKTLQEQSEIKDCISQFEKLCSDMEDADCLFELAVGEGDPNSIKEAHSMLVSV